MRFPKIRTVAFLLAIMRESYFLMPMERSLRDHFAKQKAPHAGKSAPLVLVQCVEDYFYYVLFGEIVAGLRASGPVRIEQYSARSIRAGSSITFKHMFWNSVRENCFSDWKWRRLYGAFADRTAYRATGWLHPWTALRLWWTARRLWRGLKSVDDLAQLTAQGIWIGDLIIDSYIRFKPSPSVDLSDPYLFVVIRQALKNICKATRYIKRKKPRLLLTSYTTYIQHGIPARVAARHGVLVYAFSNSQEFTTQITSETPWHTRDGRNYKTDFSKLPDQTEKLKSAERQLNDRLSGKIDAATSYMKKSAYGSAATSEFFAQNMPVIFLHDFYDSVHVYRWICFHDFWSWICFTIDTLKAAKIAFAVKPHPNQVAASSNALNLLLEKYPDLKVIPTSVTNDQLVRSGMTCAVTVYGTVASEMAFMGVPTISCGDNPHIGFDFCHTARSHEEYAKLLLDHHQLGKICREEMQRESCIFYYMHNLHLGRSEQVLKDKIMELRRRLLFGDTPVSHQEAIEAATDFAAGPALRAFCASLYAATEKDTPTVSVLPRRS